MNPKSVIIPPSFFNSPQTESSPATESNFVPIRSLISANNAASESLSLSPFRKLIISLKLSIACDAFSPTSWSIREVITFIVLCNTASAFLRSVASVFTKFTSVCINSSDVPESNCKKSIKSRSSPPTRSWVLDSGNSFCLICSATSKSSAYVFDIIYNFNH